MPAVDGHAAALSVIIVVLVGGAATERCCAAIERLSLSAIVIPPDERDVPTRRRDAVLAATTPFVALIEDTALVGPGWSSRIVETLQCEHVGAVGGPVVIAERLPAKARALALTEFGRFQQHRFAHLRSGSETECGLPVRLLPGVNFAFRRDALIAAMDEDGLVDHEVFARLAGAGWDMIYAPSMAVTYAHAHDEGARLSARFHHGRIYSSRRLAAAPVAARLLAAAKTAALPPLLVARSLREAGWSLRRSPTTFGWVALQHLCWSVGELAGAVGHGDAAGMARWQ